MTRNTFGAPLPQASDSRSIVLHNGEMYLPFHPLPRPREHLFVLDIYSAIANQHPELHLGWWAWPREIAVRAHQIRLIYRPPNEVVAYLVDGASLHDAQTCWVNPNYQLSAFQQLNLIWYDQQHTPRKQAVLVLTVDDSTLLQNYYTDHAQWYSVDTPFALAFHQRRLQVLDRLFARYIRQGSRVLDIGSGHSFFYLTRQERWPYRIICMDLDRHLMKQVAPERPSFTWLTAGMQYLPFADASFDAIYAGEVLEHVPDGDDTLLEWARVLRPGGRLIVTTPNRLRLMNRINQAVEPVSPEHLIEYSYTELRDMFARTNIALLHREGIYLEGLALWRQRYPYTDPLTGTEPLQRHLQIIKPLMALGRPFPQVAFDMVFVGQKSS